MTTFAWAVLGFIGMLLLVAIGDLASEEVRGWLDLMPRAILRLAAVGLGPDMREAIYDEEWLPELIYILRGTESRPITRLIRGTTYAVGLLISVHHIARYGVPAVAQPAVESQRIFLSFELKDADIVFTSGSGKVFVGEVKRNVTSDLLRRRGFRLPPKPGEYIMRPPEKG